MVAKEFRVVAMQVLGCSVWLLLVVPVWCENSIAMQLLGCCGWLLGGSGLFLGGCRMVARWFLPVWCEKSFAMLLQGSSE